MNAQKSRKIIVASGMAVVIGIGVMTFALQPHPITPIAHAITPPAPVEQLPDATPAAVAPAAVAQVVDAPATPAHKDVTVTKLAVTRHLAKADSSAVVTHDPVTRVEPVKSATELTTPPTVNLKDDPAHTSVQSSTAMFNVYYDIANLNGFVPYVGAGAGLSYNRMSSVSFTGVTPYFNQVIGADTLTAAWALMAGAEYRFSERASLDVGYRYINFGMAQSDHGDTGGFYNPRFELKDLAAHELMVGLRYKFCNTCAH